MPCNSWVERQVGALGKTQSHRFEMFTMIHGRTLNKWVHLISQGLGKEGNAMRPFLSSFLFLILFLTDPAQAELSINPPLSEVGTSVVIAGGGFDLVPVNNQVTFTGKPQPTPAEWVSEDRKNLLVRVPQGAADGPVSVSVKNKPIGNVAFKVKPPAAWPSLSVWVGIALALFFRTFIPFWNKKLVEKRAGNVVTWNWWLVIPPLVTAIISLPVILSLLPSIGYTGNPFQDFLASFSVTHASQDLIREVQKTLPA